MPFINPVAIYKVYDLKANLDTKLRIREQDNKYISNGHLKIDNFTLMLSGLQQPDYMPSFYCAQAFVQTEKVSGAVQLAPSTITKPITEWECPYVYIVGGYASGGSVLNNIWKGQLNRLTFKPLF